MPEYERRRRDLAQRDQALAEQEAQLSAQAERHEEVAGLAIAIEEFCARVQRGLVNATFEQKRQRVELLIDRVIVTDAEVEIRYVIPTHPSSEHIRFCHLRKDYFHGPDLVGPADVQAAQQVREDRMTRLLAAGVRMPVQRFDAHRSHQRRDMAATDLEARQAQKVSEHPRARERVIEVQLVDPPHQRQITLGDWLRDRVDRRARQIQSFALAHHREFIGSVDHRFALASPMRPSAVDKKSFSIAN